MSLPQRIGAYNDCFAIFEQAKTSGARVMFDDYADAKIFTLRMQQARALQREEHKRIYEPTSPQWGYSEYDHLMVRHPVEDTDGKWWVYIDLAGSNIIAVEPLGQKPYEAPDAQ